MVSAAWILLALSCKAKELGIILPLKGIDAISQEDIKRDLWLYDQSNGELNWYRERMKSMGLSVYPSKQSLCVGAETEFSIVACDAGTLGGALATVSLISLAKSLHHSDRGVSFCLYPSCKEIGEYDLWIKDLSGIALLIVDKQAQTEVAVKNRSDLNYIRIRQNLRRIAKTILSPE